ncbi:MAG: T9SS type A sorting domain-containing protein [Bacteroidia bacterium]
MTKTLCVAVVAVLFTLTANAGKDAVQHVPHAGTVATTALVTTAYPNPFTENTTIFYSAPEDAFVRVKLYNSQGKLMGQLYDDVVEKGSTYQFELDGTKMLPGIYYYTIETEKCVLHQRLELVR